VTKPYSCSCASRACSREIVSSLVIDAPRDVYFDAVRTAITEYYLADPSNPYQQSGRSSGPERWEETRHCIVEAVHRVGDFLANVFYWRPTRQFDFVRTNLDYVQRQDWAEFISHQYTAVGKGGRLIVCHYRNEDDARVDVRALLIELGYAVVGQTEAPGNSVAWCERNE
jgi:hypothetical protein